MPVNTISVIRNTALRRALISLRLMVDGSIVDTITDIVVQALDDERMTAIAAAAKAQTDDVLMSTLDAIGEGWRQRAEAAEAEVARLQAKPCCRGCVEAHGPF